VGHIDQQEFDAAVGQGSFLLRNRCQHLVVQPFLMQTLAHEEPSLGQTPALASPALGLLVVVLPLSSLIAESAAATAAAEPLAECADCKCANDTGSNTGSGDCGDLAAVKALACSGSLLLLLRVRVNPAWVNWGTAAGESRHLSSWHFFLLRPYGHI
jgi:hypothetical protein